MTPFALHLMRHGEPELTGRLLGRTQSSATTTGIAACRAQAANLGAVRIVTSDLSRAQACAAAIGTPTIDPRWRELDFGEWDGLAPEMIDADALARFRDDPDACPPPGGERWSDLRARVGAAIAGLPSEPTLVVTHGGAIRAALSLLCGFDLARTWAFDLPYAALVTLNVWPIDPRVAQITGLRA